MGRPSVRDGGSFLSFFLKFLLALSLAASKTRGRPHLRPEGGGLLGETGRCEVTDHVRHGPVQRTPAGHLALDAPGDRGIGGGRGADMQS